MKRRILSMALVALAVALPAGPSFAATMLWTRPFNVNGTSTMDPAPVLGPPSTVVDGMDHSSGLGQIRIEHRPGVAGDYKFIMGVDIDIDFFVSYTDESGSTTGTPEAGQSWEIDEPEFIFGDIWTNLNNGALDNTNAVPVSSPYDVGMALGWDYHLDAYEYAVITMSIRHASPSTSFYLSQTDLASSEVIHLSSTLDIAYIPEPVTVLGVILGLGGLGGYVRRRRSC